MADNVIVRVPEQQFIRGEDGYSPEVTIEDIAHGHRITITDREHQEEGQTFNVLDGDSAYEQAVAGGYTGTEAQFNAELAAFKDLSDETKEAAPFYVEYGVTTKAEIQAAINGKRQIYLHHGDLGGIVAPYTGTFLYADIWGEGTGYGFALTNGNFQYVYELKSEWTYSIYDLTAPAQRAETAAAQALTRMNSADASAQAAAETATTFTEETAPAAVNTINEAKADALTAVGNAQTTAVGAVQQESATQQAAIQQKGEDTIASIPEDYTELSGDVAELQSAFNADLVPTTWAPDITKGSYYKVADGATASSNKYARTSALWDGYGTRKAIAVNDPTYEFCLALYDETGTTSGTGYQGYVGYTKGIVYIPQNAKLFGISFRRTDNAALANSDITAISAALSALAATDTTLSVAGAPADAKATGYLRDALDNGSLLAESMGFGKTSTSSGRSFEVLKNHVNTIVSASSSAYRGVNLFGTPEIFSCTTATMESVVSALEAFPVKIPTGYDLILTVEFEHTNSTNVSYICGATKNEDADVVTYKNITNDSVKKRIINLTNLMPEIAENGNLCLAIINRHTSSANNFIYHLHLEKKMVEAPYYYDIATGITSETYGCKFVASKYHIDAECIIPSSGTTAYRGCPLLGVGSLSNIATVIDGTRDFSSINYLPINFDTDCYDLCISVTWNTAYTQSKNYLYVATKDANGQAKHAVVFRDHSLTKKFINVFDLLPDIKKNKNVQFIFENQDRNYPNGFNYSLCLRDNSNNVPEYYYDGGYIDERLSTIMGKNNTMSSNIFKTDSFVWITDPHIWAENVLTQNNGMQSAKLIKYLIDNIRIPKVFCGGDLHNGNSMTPNASKKLVEKANEYFGIIRSDLFMIVGNHEWNNPGNDAEQVANELNEQTLYNLIVKYKEKDYISISEKMDYFIDNKPQKIRYFCISCTKSGGIFDETATWFADELTRVPDGYTVVVLSHVGASGNNEIYSAFNKITNALDAAKNKTTYLYNGVTYDYSGFNADIACVISGHVHNDYSATTASGIPVISTTCDRAAKADSSDLVKCMRKIGTIGEQAFDVVQIDTENRKIYMTRIGGSTVGAVYDAENDAVVDEDDYDSGTGTITEGATRYSAAEWVRYSPYKDREFSY